MPSVQRLSELPLQEKLRMMEALWEGLSRTPGVFEWWHREVLEDRERRIVSEEARFIDWEKAKNDIRKEVS
jgi:hypothetical protein